VQQARSKHHALAAGIPAVLLSHPTTPVTILEGLERACNVDMGCYPKDSPHRREVERELKHAARILGDQPFNAIHKPQLTMLWRRRHTELARQGAVGVRGAEVAVARLLAVAEWLRGDQLIEDDACKAWKDWKKRLRDEAGSPEPHRPRYTLEEWRRLLKAAPEVDPRLGLALALGAELRGGQVIRCYRTHLDLEAETLTVPGKGQKRGAVVALTKGQLACARHVLTEGYLSPLERIAPDYPLFPAGKLTGRKVVGGTLVGRHRSGHRVVATSPLMAKPGQAGASPLTRHALDNWMRKAEALAGIEHVNGRSWYGMRRQAPRRGRGGRDQPGGDEGAWRVVGHAGAGADLPRAGQGQGPPRGARRARTVPGGRGLIPGVINELAPYAGPPQS
jgi:integrase